MKVLIFILIWVVLYNTIAFLIAITFNVNWIDVKLSEIYIVTGIFVLPFLSAYLVDELDKYISK